MTSHTEVVDALIIGGGPAGAAAARLLSAWGHSVLLLTRRSLVGALGESIPPSCRKLLDQVGLAAAVDQGDFVHTFGNTIWWAGEERVVAFAPGSYGYQVKRSNFDDLLLQQAALAGARVIQPATVRRVSDETRDGRVVDYDADSSAHAVLARWVLDCSGRAGIVARRGLRRPEAGRTLALVASWERAGWGLPDETHTVVESYPAGWAWSVPVSPTRRCLALMVDPVITAVSGRTQLAALYHAELDRAVRLRGLVAGATLAEGPWACEASAYGARRVSDDGVLLVGDAASFVDPLSSFGVKKALASAWLAAVVTHTCLTQPELQSAALQLHETREALMYRKLQAASADFSRSAAGSHAHEFWLERALADGGDADGDPDVAALRRDASVLSAFAALRRAESMKLRQSDSVRRVERPIVRGNRVALAPHLANPAFPLGIRYVRDVDLLKLAELVSGFGQVPDLYEAYNRCAPPVALPDFLGALSLLIAKGVLEPA